MTGDARPKARRFVRLYYDDLERDYPGIYFDPTCFSTFSRLLIAADKAWPSLPELYKAVRRADLSKLTDCGLVELAENGRYSMRGYAKERGERATQARKGASAKWHPNGHADADADAVA